MQQSRTALLTRYAESLLLKKRRSRSGDTSALMFSGYNPARACSTACSLTSVPKICRGQLNPSCFISRKAMASE